MEREILFRGKRNDNGEWIIGGYYHGEVYNLDEIDIHYIIPCCDLYDEDLELVEVIPETVGQFTGLKDKNGVRVFEGDILSAHFDESYPDDETLLLVGNNGYAFTLKEEDSDPEMIDNSDMRFFDEIFVVIGNVHDNPELLKGE